MTVPIPACKLVQIPSQAEATAVISQAVISQVMRGVRANGGDTYYREAGPAAGFPVLLLHGFPDSADLWGRQLYALSRAGFRAIAPDLRGFGRSSRPAGVAHYVLSKIQADVVALLDELKIQR